eukprot:COSAG01_NODE_12217_length_1778_cov_1.442525_2_plen_161_part_00
MPLVPTTTFISGAFRSLRRSRIRLTRFVSYLDGSAPLTRITVTMRSIITMRKGKEVRLNCDKMNSTTHHSTNSWQQNWYRRSLAVSPCTTCVIPPLMPHKASQLVGSDGFVRREQALQLGKCVRDLAQHPQIVWPYGVRRIRFGGGRWPKVNVCNNSGAR